MERKKRALVAFHDPSLGNVVSKLLKRQGYEIQLYTTLDATLKAIGAEPGSFDTCPFRHEFDLLMMDANLGYPKVNRHDPALEVYRFIKNRGLEGQVNFRAYSSHPDTVASAIKAGIPAEFKDFDKIFEYVRGLN